MQTQLQQNLKGLKYYR